MSDALTGVDIARVVGIVEAASKTAMSYFRQLLAVETKGDESPVTVADKQVEAEIRNALSTNWPGFGILGEEFGAEGLEKGSYWVVDPIDGTRSFIAGLPLFGMLLGLMQGGKPVLGIVGMPALGEIYVGEKGRGATLNGQTIATSDKTRLSDATLFINEGEKLAVQEPDLFAALCQTGATRRMSYDCYPHALVASGHVDTVVDFDLQPYDYLPVVPLVEAAGGCMTDWEGNPLGLNSDGRVVSAATPELLAETLALIAAKRSGA